jgi:xanthine dehydrogenase small subunit
MRDHIVFHVNGREHRARGREVFNTLSNWLRYDAGATGTKIVCEEGDCGACTVLMRRSPDADFKPVNSCIQALFQLDGMSIVTVEGLKVDGVLSAVQEAMVAAHGAQCGYCTPGFVVAMTALYETKDRVDDKDVRDGLTGNLCRCTGYEPIIKAALAVHGGAMPKMREQYPALPDSTGSVQIETHGRRFLAAATLDEALLFKADTNAVIVQGGTDVGVWVNKRGYAAPAMLSLAKIESLYELRADDDAIVAGANVTLAALEEQLEQRVPELFRILNIFGSPQIKNAGTLAGNIANGSPIADTLPYLFVAGARLELASIAGTREVPIESFYRGYKTFDLHPGELITRVTIPIVRDTLKLYKVSRRKDLDISAFTAAIRLRLSGNRIDEARVAYGGVGPVVMRLPKTEAFLSGRTQDEETFVEAGRIARGEVTPISDVRGSRDYRLQLAENILQKFYFDAFAG